VVIQRVHCNIRISAYLQYILIRFNPSFFLLYPPSPLLRAISTGFIVLFTFMSTKYFHLFALFHPFFMPSHSRLYPPPDRTCFTFLSFIYQKRTFLLVYDSYTGGFVVTFPYIHVLYPELAHPLHSSCSLLLLVVTVTVFSVPYSYMYRKYIDHIHLLYPPSSTSALP
jgi:hypothetical protein